MSKPIAVVWFRRDLRLADNPALCAAITSGANVLPLYIHAPETEVPWQRGAASKVCLHYSLQALDTELQRLGSRLIVRSCKNTADILNLLQSFNPEAVYWNRLYDPAIIERDKQIKVSLLEQAISVKSYKASLLFEPWELETGQGTPYRVFTPMWKNMLKQGIQANPVAAPASLPGVSEAIKSDALASLHLLPKKREHINGQAWHTSMATHWQMSEAAAHQRLSEHSDTLLDEYKVGRDFPAYDYTSKMSVYLHFGQISPAQATHAIRQAMAMAPPAKASQAEDNGAAYIREIAWREFAHHVLYHYPHITDQPMQPKFANFTWDKNPEYVARWQRGQTGIPIIDAGMRQLWQTGWMHNRVRMIVGSLLTKNLRIHWLEGVSWFWDTLVDADLANNTLGWQWIAGCGADAAPYFRIFNPVSQSERFDKEGVYIKQYVPELKDLPAKYIHAPWEAPESILQQANVELDKHYPMPIVDLKVSRQAALDAYKSIKSS